MDEFPRKNQNLFDNDLVQVAGDRCVQFGRKNITSGAEKL